MIVQTPFSGKTHATPSFRVLSNKQAQVGLNVKQDASRPKFAGAYSNLLNHLDYRSFGTSSVSQIQVVYAGCILWRLIAANERRRKSPTKSWNEVREILRRDPFGYMLWFFATPMLQRAILVYISKYHDPSIGESLRRTNPKIAQGKGLLGKLKAWNPLYRIEIPSSAQIKDLWVQCQKDLEKAGFTKGTPAFQKVQAHCQKLLMYRNIATGLGLLNTIAWLGLIINLLNFYLTRKNVEKRMLANQAHAVTPPKGSRSEASNIKSSPNLTTKTGSTQTQNINFPVPSNVLGSPSLSTYNFSSRGIPQTLNALFTPSAKLLGVPYQFPERERLS